MPLNRFQITARQMLSDLADALYLSPTHLSSDNGVQYDNNANHTVFTVYHDKLDTPNRDAIEVAVGVDLGIPEECKRLKEEVADWFQGIASMFPAAKIKPPEMWPRVSLHSPDQVELFARELKKLIDSAESQPAVRLPREPSPPLPRKSLAPPSPKPPVTDTLVMRQIVERRGQPAFRQALLAAYERSCAISRCTDTVVLEAAHITPHTEGEDYRTANGLLLRADLHTLFDLHLLSIDPATGTVFVSRRLSQEYQQFSKKRIHLPERKEHRPDLQGLKKHYLDTQAGERWFEACKPDEPGGWED